MCKSGIEPGTRGGEGEGDVINTQVLFLVTGEEEKLVHNFHQFL